MRLLALILALTLLPPALGAADAAILNTLQGFDDDAPGWSGGAEASFDRSGGNTDELALVVAARAQRLGARDRWRLQAALGQREVDGRETARARLVHLRHNHRLAGPLHSLAFVQLQNNRFQRLDWRWLWGAGLRWDLRADARGVVSLGAAHMLETEHVADTAGDRTSHRLSAFLHVGRPLRDGVRLDAAAFYQPRWSDFGDRRAMGRATLTVALTRTLSLKVGWSLEHDSRPPAGVARDDWGTSTGLSLDF